MSLDDCEEQLKDWARELVDAEIRRRPEGKKLKQLEDLQRRSIDTVMESGTPDDLIKALDAETKKIGIAWVVPYFKIKQNKLTIDLNKILSPITKSAGLNLYYIFN